MKISARIVADSLSPQEGTRIVTLECEYPRFIHSEFMTHRMLSKNSASSRAIPVSRMCENIDANYAEPVSWGKNQAGMQANSVLTDSAVEEAKKLWVETKNFSIAQAKKLHELEVHKQIVNRVTEPFVITKTLVTGTEWDNFFALRMHPAAQPEIQVLAREIHTAMQNSIPRRLTDSFFWHMPFVDWEEQEGEQIFFIGGEKISLADALRVSVSCCAQVSYRKLDFSMEKAGKIFNMLNVNQNATEPAHASPLEHQARTLTMEKFEFPLAEMFGDNFEYGVTHVDRKLNCWSGNLKHFAQFRHIIGEDPWIQNELFCS